MKAVCDLLPETLNDADLETTGHLTKCNLKFTSKLHPLKNSPSTSADQPSATSSYFLQKTNTDTTEAASLLFPKECNFCGKFEIKV